VQEDAADRVLEMLRGAMAQLGVGNPARLATDVGPVIDAEAQRGIGQHLERLRALGRRIHQPEGSTVAAPAAGTFVPPTLIEIDGIGELEREVFGPVLHFVRYRRDALDDLLGAIRATGYGLTLGLHTRIDETIARVVAGAHAGNVYVNRNMVGAVVGVQPFGGEGLSGTGPKAGGPLYLHRLLATQPEGVLARVLEGDGAAAQDAALQSLLGWLAAERPALHGACSRYAPLARRGASVALPGPTGERNVYTLVPREAVLCLAGSDDDRLVQLAAVLAVGSRALWPAAAGPLLQRLPAAVRERVSSVEGIADARCDAVLLHGSREDLATVQQVLAHRQGPVIGVERLEPGDVALPLERLVLERALSINTAAAGGNATLMALG
ncbi:MAG: aldehyde dehydrogenase family protein, partial [Comamonadaceae bacterium]